MKNTLDASRLSRKVYVIPDYVYAALDSSNLWNFTKFLLDREGKVIARYAPVTTPKAIASAIGNYFTLNQTAVSYPPTFSHI